MALVGPFQVDPEDIERLGAAFTQYVNELLAREAARARLLGYQLRIDSQDTTPDGGVDAALESEAVTTWLPSGKSCWQFKRGDLAPAKCAAELAKAEWAKELMKRGAAYTLLLGRRLGDQKIETRRKSLIAKAKELGILGDGDEERIQVLDANALARWSSEFPSLAVHPILRAPGRGVTDYGSWSSSNRHDLRWVPNDDRTRASASIREVVSSETFSEIHIGGESGVGKTRLVMEALRTDELSPLVVYIPDQQSVSGDVLAYVLSEHRVAILVVDECSGRSHEKLAERIPAASALRLVTIGELDDYVLRAPVLPLATMEQTDIEEFLKANYPALSAEAQRFVSEQCLGNVRFAIVLARRILESGVREAAELISRGDAEQLVQALLPEGRPFYLAAVLALLERVGWEKELASQLAPVAAFAGATEDEVRAVARDLEARGLLAKQGRYRAVAPHPVAVVLAATAWRSEGARIVDELLPTIDREMGLSLFSRVAALGRYEPARRVLRQLMSRDGPFGTLGSIEEHELGRFLTQLAIVAPEETMLHLGELIQSASLDELRAATGSRRDLVWTLEKLAWHRQTFESAADALLRLALAENETWANNATGTWIDLFGTMLPGTAATPEERINYLTRVAANEDVNVRLMSVKACARALAAMHESITVSGEIQGGALVEPRGQPSTWGEVGDYRRAAIELLTHLSSDDDADVRTAAADVLIDAIHGLVDDPFVGDDLVEALNRLPEEFFTRLRRDIEHLINLHERAETRDRPEFLSRLRHLADSLPRPDKREQLRVLLHLRRWDLQDDELQERFTGALESLDENDLQWLLDLANSEEWPAAWELGTALAASARPEGEVLEKLVDAFPTNPAALVGYLRGRADHDDESAFDRFLDSSLASSLPRRDALAIAARGPLTEKARSRILTLAQEMSVSEAASALFGWQRELSDDEVVALVSKWSERVESQQDYNVLVDWINLRRPDEADLPEQLRPLVLRVVMMRKDFPAMGQQRWDWSQLARRFVADNAVELAQLVLNMIDDDDLMIHPSDYESQILVEAVKAQPQELWKDIAGRIGAGSWRLQMEIRGWLVAAMPVGVLDKWIGQDLERARLVASISPVGGDEPTAIARLLLERFEGDEDVRGSLWGGFMAGTWMGPESARLQRQIEQLSGWRSRDGEPEGVRRWAAEMIEYLERRREQALQEEAERGF